MSRNSLLALFAAALGFVAVTFALPPETAPPAPARPLLLDGPAFRDCESEAYMALSLARQAFWFTDTKEDLLGLEWVGASERATIEELFRRKESGELGNHLAFASEKLQECAARKGLVLTMREVERTTGCYARVNVLFLLQSFRNQGKSPADAIAGVAKVFAKEPRKLFPEKLPAELAPITFAHADRYRDLTRQLFARCVFPRDWNAWRERHADLALFPAASAPVPSEAAAQRTSAAHSKRFVECAVAMTWRARAQRDAGQPFDYEFAAAKHYLRVACALTGPEGIEKQFVGHDGAVDEALRKAVAKDYSEGLKRWLGQLDTTLEACAAEEEQSLELVRAADFTKREGCRAPLFAD